MSYSAADHLIGSAREPRANPLDKAVLWTVVPAAALYNGFLAIINAHVLPLGFAHVALVELLLLTISLIYILYRGISEDMLALVILVGFFALVTAYVSVTNAMVFIDFLRNIMIVAIFCALGQFASGQTITRIFRFVCIAVLAVLLLEIFLTQMFEDLFYPALYFINTRGLEQISFNGSKLFQNAIKIPDRFSFGLADHRTASVFLEQVSLANFAGVLDLYLITRFRHIGKGDRVLMASTAILILLTNDSRTMSAFTLICIAGYFIFPKIPGFMRALIMPAVLLAGILVFAIRPDAVGDSLDGRIVLTMRGMSELDFVSLLALNAREVARFADSGYLYIINASTIFGLVAFWLFVSFYPAHRTDDQRRLGLALAIFLFLNLMIGGTAIFSVKIAAMIWLLVGFEKRENAEDRSETAETVGGLERIHRL